MSYRFEPIAVIHSPYREKFATPRQPGLNRVVRAEVELFPEFGSPEAVRELDGFSHIWLLFLFHLNYAKGWKPTVRPPRLGGNQKVGVFASRSPFRPNPIGLSAVELLKIDCAEGRAKLEVRGVDLIDGTPLLDIKPYIPYSDSIPAADGGFARRAPEQLPVAFSAQAAHSLTLFSPQSPDLRELIVETLALDPRPAYQRDDQQLREYGALLDRYNVRWRVEQGTVMVLGIDLTER